MARQIRQAEESGQVVITVPGWLASTAQAWIWQCRVDHAGEKWAARAVEVTPEQWGQVMMREGQSKLRSPGD